MNDVEPVYFAIGGINPLGKFQLGEPTRDEMVLRDALDTVKKDHPELVDPSLKLYQVTVVSD